MFTISAEGIDLSEKSIFQIKQIVRSCIDEALKTEHQKANPLEKPNLITRKECSEILGVSLVTLNDWDKKNILIPIRIGTRVRYSMQTVQEFLSNRKPKTMNDGKDMI